MRPPAGAKADVLEKIRSTIKKKPPNIGTWSHQRTVQFKQALKQVSETASFTELTQVWRYLVEVYGIPEQTTDGG